MELIEKLINELDVEINNAWQMYVDAHTELNTFSEKNIGTGPIGDHRDEVNRLLQNIYDKFNILWPAYHFIATRHESMTNAVTGFNDFIERLKKGGAQQNGPEVLEG